MDKKTETKNCQNCKLYQTDSCKYAKYEMDCSDICGEHVDSGGVE